MKIIERIFEIMNSKNIKNIQLAERLGINKSVVSSWKSRNNNPPTEMIVQISELLGVSPIYILTGKENTNNLSEEEKCLLNNYSLLSERNKGKVETYIDERLQEQQEQGKDTKRDLA